MTGKLKISQGRIEYYFLTIFFTVSFWYFFSFAGQVLFFQKEQNLFIFSWDYLTDFLLKPGGLLEYTGLFLTQFYSSHLFGSIILTSVLTLPGLLMIHINKILNFRSSVSIIFVLLPSSLMFLMQAHYYHLMVYNLGFISVMLYFDLSVKQSQKTKYIMFALLPLFYYLAGAYAILYLVLCLIYTIIFERGKNRIYLSALPASLLILSFFLSGKFLFLLPSKQLLTFPLPLIEYSFNKVVFIILTLLIILYPVLVKYLNRSFRFNFLNKTSFGYAAGILILSACCIVLIRLYDPQTNRVLSIEKLAFEEKWEELIKYQEKYPSENLIGQYFYNIALSETNLLCERVFYGKQDFGTKSLILPWGNDHLNWGSWFFYSAGLSNEAHRWAYEEMVVYGLRPENLKMLVKTSLIKGDFRMAEKYIGILKKTIYYREWAKIHDEMARDSLKLMSDKGLGTKIKIFPKSDFFIYMESPETNLPQLVECNPLNRNAFEYLMAWLMLSKNVETLVNSSIKLKEMGYTHIPRHIEEAILIYYNSKKIFPDLGGLTISSETQLRFNQYFAAYIEARKRPATLKEKMAKFDNTFWYYYHFK